MFPLDNSLVVQWFGLFFPAKGLDSILVRELKSPQAAVMWPKTNKSSTLKILRCSQSSRNTGVRLI